MTDEELLEVYNTGVDADMHMAAERDGFASNTSRESLVAGLRAIEREAAAKVLTEFADAQDSWCEKGRAEQMISRAAMREALRARAAEYRREETE